MIFVRLKGLQGNGLRHFSEGNLVIFYKLIMTFIHGVFLSVWFSYDVMLRCWQPSPDDRPSFEELHIILQEILHEKEVRTFITLMRRSFSFFSFSSL